MAKSKKVADVTSRAPCDCGGAFDAEKAILALSRDVARLADLVAMGSQGARAGRSANEAPPAAPASKARGARSLAGDAEAVPAYIRILQESRRALEDASASPSEIVGGRPTRDFPSCCCIGDA